MRRYFIFTFVLLFLLLANQAAASNEADIHLYVQAVPELHVAFYPEGQLPPPYNPHLQVVNELTGSDLQCRGGACYSTELIGNVRGGTIEISQTQVLTDIANPRVTRATLLLVSRDEVTWTLPRGTVANLAATYSVDPLGNLLLASFRRVDSLALTPLAGDRLPNVVGLTPVAASMTTTTVSPLSATSSDAATTPNTLRGCGGLLVLMGLIVASMWGLVYWRAGKAAGNPAGGGQLAATGGPVMPTKAKTRADEQSGDEDDDDDD